MLCRVKAVKSLPVHFYSAGYILISFGVIEPILVILKIKYRLPALGGGGGGRGGVCSTQTTVLHMKRLNQIESPIFMILCVLCFQRISFLTFIVNSRDTTVSRF